MLNLENILTDYQNMGPAFWAGAAAIALGATLLIVSLLTMLRRVKLTGIRTKNSFAGSFVNNSQKTSSENIPQNAGTARKTSSGYEPGAFPAYVQEPAKVVESDPIAGDLTDRMHRAANTLEEIIQGLQKENHSNAFSPLKEDTDSVEYLFKTTVG